MLEGEGGEEGARDADEDGGGEGEDELDGEVRQRVVLLPPGQKSERLL